ncbi:MAG: GNAT family N-acetyltransferase [Pseudomonadota bacterium]
MQIERLQDRHLADIIALHHLVLAGIPAGFAARESDDFFAGHLDECGRIFGIYAEGTLMVYGVLGLPRPGDANFGDDHHLSAELLPKVAHIDGVAVHPAWRGQGWQRKMIAFRLAQAPQFGRNIALSTAAPANRPSVISLLSCGLSIRGIVEKFGGTRYLMRRDLVTGVNNDTAISADAMTSSQWVIMDDVQQQQRALVQGRIGYAFAQTDGIDMIAYGRATMDHYGRVSE